jgi:integrase
MPEFLTPDNIQLSRPTNALEPDHHPIAINCNRPTYMEFVRNNLSLATQAAYRSDLRMYEVAGGVLPATPEQIATYLADQSRNLAPASLERRLIAISKAHDMRSLPNPVRTDLVQATMRGIKRMLGTAQRQAAPLLKDDLFEILAKLGDRPKDIRDAAILLVGFSSALRRSELVALNREDITNVPQGLVLTIRRSKTDPMGRGRKIGVAFGRTRWCPIAVLELWLGLANIHTGPLFRRVDRHGHILNERLAGEAISLIVKDRVGALGLNASNYSGHSLRAGFVTSAALSGVSTWAIRKTTGHKSDQMLSRYIRDGSLFSNYAANDIL